MTKKEEALINVMEALKEEAWKEYLDKEGEDAYERGTFDAYNRTCTTIKIILER